MWIEMHAKVFTDCFVIQYYNVDANAEKYVPDSLSVVTSEQQGHANQLLPIQTHF